MIAYPFVGAYQRTVAPTLVPVSIEEAREQLRIVGNTDDSLILRLIKAGMAQFEAETGRQVMRATWQLKLDAWPAANVAIELPYPPAISVSSIAYLDADGASQTLAASVYSVSTVWEPGLIRLAYNQSWPAIRGVKEAITITWLAGYAAAADVPETWRQAILMLVASLYENAEKEVLIQGGDFTESKTYRSLLNASRWF